MWMLFEDDPCAHGRHCHECGIFSSWDFFYNLKHGKNGHGSICKQCKNRNRALTARMRRIHAMPLGCQRCGRRGNLQVDHDHETHLFRAFLCCHCNLAARRWHWGRTTT